MANMPPGTPPPAPQAQSPGGGAAPQNGTGKSPMDFLQMIQHGYQGLAPFIQKAGKQLPPEDLQLFGQAQKISEALIQSLTQGQNGPGNGPPSKAPVGGQTPAGASPKGSAPSTYGGG